jgi:flagellar basal-body rod protein FlgF
MEQALFVSLSQQMAMRRTMDVIANNLANMSTTSYKSETVLFEEYLMPVVSDDGSRHEIAFVIDSGLARDFTEGRIELTGAPLDLAISGRGFFAIETPGEIQFTRNGHFKLDDEGRIVTQDGHPLLDVDNNPIVVGLGAREFDIAPDGTLTTNDLEDFQARIQIVDFDNLAGLEKTGSNLYRTNEMPRVAENASILQGMIETSNVNPILEMTRMIEVLRQYQAAARLNEQGSELSRQAIERLGRTQA